VNVSVWAWARHATIARPNGTRILSEYTVTTPAFSDMPRFPGSFFLQNMVERRTLLFQLVRRDFKTRYVGSAAGWLWGVVHPLVLLASWTFVFQVCLKVPPPEGVQNYTMFLFAGFLPWLLFQDTLARSASCLLESSNLITKTVFPSEVLPVSVFLSSLIHHFIGLAVVLVAVGLVLKTFSPMVVFLPVYMFLLGLFAVGIGWVVASLQVYLRDTTQVLTVILTLWFWMTPIFLEVTQVPERLRWIVNLNPMSWIVRGYRERLLSNTPPSLTEILMISSFAVVTFILGGLVFRQLKRGFADVL
jgi:ABC-type polysaccharide/polyol phosphate export permease